jgi:ribosome-associated protein
MTLITKSLHASQESSTQPQKNDPSPQSKRLRNTRPAQDDVPVSAAAHARPERIDCARERAIACARIAEDNRARDIVLLDMRSGTSLVDFFLIASVVSRRQASALANDIAVAMKRAGESRLGIEGAEDGRWVLLDYGDFIIHIFSEDARAYYELDQLWGDAPHVQWQTPALAATP